MKLEQTIVVGALALATEVAAAPAPPAADLAQFNEASQNSRKTPDYIIRNSVPTTKESDSADIIVTRDASPETIEKLAA
jgi:hypothetical protein